MRTAELARAAGVDAETLRYYEKAGLLAPPARGANGYRAYDDAALQRLRFIRNCRALDMSLDEIRALLRVVDDPAADRRAVDAVIAEHLRHVRERLAALRTLEGQLKELQRACGDPEAHRDCGIVRALSGAPRRAVRGVHSR